MGYMRHDAIIVTSFKGPDADVARKKAIEIGLVTTPPVKSDVNGYVSFMIATDGSKEGWKDSDDGDAMREKWKQWAVKNDRELSLYWVHVSYAGDDSDDTAIVDKWPR